MGVDTHTDTHTAVALDQLGWRLGSIEIPADARGYRCRLEWVRPLGELSSVGVEGTGSYGARLSRFLTAAGVTVIEVGRVNRQHRCPTHTLTQHTENLTRLMKSGTGVRLEVVGGVGEVEALVGEGKVGDDHIA